MPEIQLQPADIFATRGRSWISAAICFFTRSCGEARTKASHVGVVVVGGSLDTTVVVEALWKVERHKLIAQYGNTQTAVAVYRPLNLTDEEKEIVVRKAERYVNERYGVFKLVAHLADWALQGIYLFRRFAIMDRYPICSWLVAHAFAKIGKYFDVPPGAASPDDIFDFMESHPDVYTEILPMARVVGKAQIKG